MWVPNQVKGMVNPHGNISVRAQYWGGNKIKSLNTTADAN